MRLPLGRRAEKRLNALCAKDDACARKLSRKLARGAAAAQPPEFDPLRGSPNGGAVERLPAGGAFDGRYSEQYSPECGPELKALVA